MNDRLVALLARRGRFWVAEPFFGATPAQRAAPAGFRPRRLTLASNRVGSPDPTGARSAREGQLVLIGVPTSSRGGRGGGQAGARIERVLGSPEVAREVIEALMLDHGLQRDFRASLEREAREAAERQARDQATRRDLRGLATITIDPLTARDFDDAISAQPMGEGQTKVYVHIADVTAYVHDGSLLDREARRRSTSVYVPGAVEPMLPPALSNEACSLLPGQDRLAVTVEMNVRNGKVLTSSFYRSLIRSDERLDYERVDRIFAGFEFAAEPWAATLQAAREAAAQLGQTRAARAGTVELDVPESEFAFDASGHVSEIAGRVQTESHRLIEHLMIAANEAVAELLQKRGVPCLYRVHERPQPERVERLVEQLASLGVQTPPLPQRMSPSQAGRLMGEIAKGVEAHLRAAEARARKGDRRIPATGGRLGLTSLVLRSLQQAQYSPRNIGHAGLGSACYCHFTSPIRRYPDIVCHRALLSTIGGQERTPRSTALQDLGEWTSNREREAMTIERDAEAIARCFALERRLYEQGFEQVFAGEVTGVISAGAFVAFGEPLAGREPDGRAMPLPYEGMLPVRRLRGPEAERDWWEVNEQGTILHGERSGTMLRIGDAVAVKVSSVETARGRVDLTLAG